MNTKKQAQQILREILKERGKCIICGRILKESHSAGCVCFNNIMREFFINIGKGMEKNVALEEAIKSVKEKYKRSRKV